MKKLVAAILMCSALGAVAETTPAIYQKSCFACHSTGAAGAPKTHDTAAWAPRIAQGMPIMLEHVKKGFKAMPPGGMCTTCTDAEYTALIEFMSTAAPAQ